MKAGVRAQINWRIVLTCLLFSLVGINLRSVILGVPPVLPLIKHDLGLSYTATGLLTSLPVLVMAGFAMPSGLLADHFGARRMVTLGLLVLAAAAIARGIFPQELPVFAFTALLSGGIAIAQTAMPILARQWFPRHIGLVSALFSDGLIIGEALAAGITVPLILGIFGPDAWATSFVVWGIPVAVTVFLWLWLAPRADDVAPKSWKDLGSAWRTFIRGTGSGGSRQVSALHLGVLLGAGSLIFFGMNGWIATFNDATGRSAETAVALVALNSAQLPVSLGMTPFAQRLAGKRWPFVAAGTLASISVLGWVVTPGTLEPLWGSLLGGSSAFVFVLGIALPPLLARHGDVARLTGLTLTLSYGTAFVGPLLGGSLWDLLGLPAVAFLPVLVAALLLIVLGTALPVHTGFDTIHTPAQAYSEHPRQEE